MARPTRKGSGASPLRRPNAVASAFRWGSGRRPRSVSSGAQAGADLRRTVPSRIGPGSPHGAPPGGTLQEVGQQRGFPDPCLTAKDQGRTAACPDTLQ